MNALALTMTDLGQQVVGAAIATGDLPSSLGGLRGGYLRVRGQHRAVLTDYEFIPGVKVSGTYDSQGTSSFTLSGSGARGKVKISKSGHATGRLDGHKINLRPRATSASVHTTALSWRDALQHHALR